MKLRIKDNSIRLRLSQDDISHLAEYNTVSAYTQFDSNQILTYQISSSPLDYITATLTQKSIKFSVPRDQIFEWATTQKVGIEAHINNGHEKDLFILIEKDYKCLIPRTHEDGDNLYPNPLARPSHGTLKQTDHLVKSESTIPVGSQVIAHSADNTKHQNNNGLKTTSIVRLKKSNNNSISKIEDIVAVESPVEIQISYGTVDRRTTKSLSITMRTPGQDPLLAIGFLFTEGLIQNYSDVIKTNQSTENTICIDLAPHVHIDMAKLERHFYTSSSCGVCGKTSIDLVKVKTSYPPEKSRLVIASSTLWNLQAQLKQHQKLFDVTGGIHAAGLFNHKGQLIKLEEDVGRHNAVDKLIGYALNHHLIPLYNYFIMVSGRASFELIQKASMAGLPMLVAVGAPSSLAVQLAEEQGMCLLGFLKKESLNIYSQFNRVQYE